LKRRALAPDAVLPWSRRRSNRWRRRPRNRPARSRSEVANAVLGAGGELAAKSGRLRAEVERFLAQVRVA